ncbi:hypothetical protein EJB05_12242, partial [Eragrostis curvula]
MATGAPHGLGVAPGLFLLVLSAAALHTPAAAALLLTQVCGTSGNYTANSTYEANIKLLRTTLPKTTSSSVDLFAKASAGAVPEIVHALALCRGDANASACGSCVATAFQDAQQLCAYDKEVTVYYDLCYLSFSNSNFLDGTDDDNMFGFVDDSPNVTSPVPAFDDAVVKLLKATADYAANNSTSRFATGEEGFDSSYPTIYGLTQCTPDLSPAECQSCLVYSFRMLPYYFSGKTGGTVVGIRCNYRYELYSFFSGSPSLLLPAPSSPAPSPPPAPVNVMPTSTPQGKKRIAAGISAGIAGSVVLILILSVFFFLRFRRRIKATENDHSPKKLGKSQCTIFDFSTLQEATEHFSDKNKLGEGGFGTVYKGILSDGEEIAVKTLLGRALGRKGQALHQLHNEVLVLAELQHKKLVRLLGFCSHQNDTLLVYEYIKNGSLDSILFSISSSFTSCVTYPEFSGHSSHYNSTGNALKWEEQYNIILGIAKGILYLHEDSSTRIVHRDLKANNILLDDDMEPKIADFGMARLLELGHTLTQTTRVVGTFGYMAPEYVMHGRVSPKIDIFSFGVLILEIVMRRSNCGSDDHNTVNLLSDVWDHWTKGSISQMLDQSIHGYGRCQALRCIHVGLLCVQVDPDDRPDISTLIFMLTRDGMELQLPEEPAFFFARGSPSASQSDGQSSFVYDRSSLILEQYISVNGLTVTEPYPR